MDRAPGSALGQFPRDAGEEGLGMDRVHRRQEDVGKDRSGISFGLIAALEDRDVAAGPKETILHDDATLVAAAAVNLMPETAGGVADPQARTHRHGDLPGIAFPSGAGLDPGISDLQRPVPR